MVYLPGAEAVWAIDHRSKNGVRSYPKTKKMNFWLKLNGRDARISKTYGSMDVIYFLGICKKKGLFISWNRFVESLRGVKLLRTYKIFWTNNKTVIEFGFRMMWIIIIRPPRPSPRWIIVSSICIILHILLNRSFNTELQTIHRRFFRATKGARSPNLLSFLLLLLKWCHSEWKQVINEI